jgi:hypothetical protein
MMHDQKPKPIVAGPWSIEQIQEYLRTTVIPIRLSVHGLSGAPVVASHWFTYDDGVLRCAVRDGSFIDRCLSVNAACGFEIARDDPPYRGVRGRGDATRSTDRDKALLKSLHDRYLGANDTAFRKWLANRNHDETAIAIKPARWTSWDYTCRMTKT